MQEKKKKKNPPPGTNNVLICCQLKKKNITQALKYIIFISSCTEQHLEFWQEIIAL